MSLARLYEQRGAANKTEKPPSTTRPAAGAAKPTPPATMPVVQPKPSGQPPAPRHRFRRLTPEELSAKRAKDECYYCTEKYVPGHKCGGKGVFLLELDDGIKLEDVADELGISLHALTGIDVADTMKLRITIAGQQLTALVDTGSTHTFVKDHVARQLGLQLTPRPGLSVKVANGDRVTSAGVCRDTPVAIGEEAFHINCYILPLDGFDVVLDVQWLKTLGPILWNFDKLTMTF